MKSSRTWLAGLAVILVGPVFAVFLGWLKTTYFLKTFGLGPQASTLDWGETLFTGWYVLQNMMFLALVLWLALRSRRWGIALGAAGYALIPLATHYAFALYANPVIRWIVDHQHTWLKFFPFVLLTIVWVRWPAGRPALTSIPARGRTVGGALVLLVLASWGVSAAKHFGSYDAARILRRPHETLPTVQLEWRPGGPVRDRAALGAFLLQVGARRLVVLELESAPRWKTPEFEILVIEREELAGFTVKPPHALQPGGQYL